MDKFYNKVNVSQIVSIKKFLKFFCTYYTWKEEKFFLGFRTRKAGFYYTFTIGQPELCSVEDIESEGIYYCKDKAVWYKPHLEIKMADGNKHEKFFETVGDLEDFLNSEELSSVKWCILE